MKMSDVHTCLENSINHFLIGKIPFLAKTNKEKREKEGEAKL